MTISGASSVVLTLLLYVSAPSRVRGQSSEVRARLIADLRNAKELRRTITDAPGLTSEERKGLLHLAHKSFPPLADSPKEFTPRVLVIHLHSDDEQDVILQPTGGEYCGATGNCSLAIFRKTTEGYSRILDTDGIQEIAVRSQTTAGYHDLLLASHDSAAEKTLYTYQFINGGYRRVACYEAVWTDPKNFTRVLNTPVISACHFR
jgi:hypothetical protein